MCAMLKPGPSKQQPWMILETYFPSAPNCMPNPRTKRRVPSTKPDAPAHLLPFFVQILLQVRAEQNQHDTIRMSNLQSVS